MFLTMFLTFAVYLRVRHFTLWRLNHFNAATAFFILAMASRMLSSLVA